MFNRTFLLMGPRRNLLAKEPAAAPAAKE